MRDSYDEGAHRGMSAQELTLTVRGAGGDRYEIAVGFRSQSDVEDFDDGNWLACAVRVKAGGFRGDVAVSLRAEEFRRFRDELRRLNATLTGAATFETMEEWTAVRLVGDGRGHIEASGFLVDGFADANRLAFRLDFDQTELARMLRELDAVLSAFPVVGK